MVVSMQKFTRKRKRETETGETKTRIKDDWKKWLWERVSCLSLFLLLIHANNTSFRYNLTERNTTSFTDNLKKRQWFA
jgi:hypothetical protein